MISWNTPEKKEGERKREGKNQQNRTNITMYGERHQGLFVSTWKFSDSRVQWSNVLGARGRQVSDTWTDGDMLMLKLEMHKSLPTPTVELASPYVPP